MLWYKAWIETRIRFLLSLVALTAFCAWQAGYRPVRFILPSTSDQYIYTVFHFAENMICVLWIPAVTILAMGGLLREKAAGTSSFTLTLPVSRSRLLGVRVCVVFVEALFLAAVSLVAVALVIGTAGRPLPMRQVWFHFALLVGGGILFIALPLLVSSLVEGEYTAPIVAFGALVALAFGFDQALQTYDPFLFIQGGRFFDRSSGLLLGPIPWMHIAITISIAALLVGISMKVIRKREF